VAPPTPAAPAATDAAPDIQPGAAAPTGASVSAPVAGGALGVAPSGPNPPQKESFGQGFSRESNPQWTTDANGRLIRAEQAAKPSLGGVLGRVLAGALSGAAAGAAGQAPEGSRGTGAAFSAGAAAAQKAATEKQTRAQALAQQNFENNQKSMEARAKQSYMNTQQIALIQKMDQDRIEFPERMRQLHLTNDDLAQKGELMNMQVQAAKNEQKNLTNSLLSFMSSQGFDVSSITHASTGGAGSPAQTDTDGKPIPGTEKKPGDFASNNIWKELHPMAPQIGSGQAILLHSGGEGKDNGAVVINPQDLQNFPLSADYKYPVYTGILDPKTGKPQEAKVGGIVQARNPVTGKQNTMYDAYLAMTGSFDQLDRTQKQSASALQAQHTMAETQNQLAEAAKNSALAKAAVSGLSQGDPTKTGDEYIATLPPQTQDLVHGLLRYQVKPSDLGRAKDRSAILAAAIHGDTTGQWSQSQYEERYNFLKEYGDTQKGAGATRDRLNTALGHLDMLSQASQALAKNNVQALNALANSFGVATGKSAKVVYDAIAQKAAAETAAAIKGGGAAPTDPEIEAARKQFDSKMAPQQQFDNIKAQMGILKTQADTVGSHFQSVMKQTPDQFGQSVLYPQNQQIMNKWLGIAPPQQYQNTHTNPQTGQQIGWNGTAWVDTKTGQPVAGGKK
jgi:hypothetical protein